MRFIIYGAGGIGCTIGAHLFRTGGEVVLVGNAQHVDAINGNGLKFLTGDQSFLLNIPAVKTAEELAPFRDDDVAMLCAKSQHTVKCLGQLKNAGASRTLPILCVQNSIWNEPTASRVFDRVYGVMIVVPGLFLTPGEVVNPIVRKYGFIEVGCYPRGTDVLCEEVVAALKRAGFSSDVHPEVMKPKGAKCLGNLGNALSAITDGRGDSKPFMEAVRQEAEAVWRAAGIEWEDRESFDQRVRENYGDRQDPPGYEGMKAHGSSWQSLVRRTGNIEAEQLNGEVVTLGRLLGVPTPFNELLWRLADEMAASHETPGRYTAEELFVMAPSGGRGAEP